MVSRSSRAAGVEVVEKGRSRALRLVRKHFQNRFHGVKLEPCRSRVDLMGFETHNGRWMYESRNNARSSRAGLAFYRNLEETARASLRYFRGIRRLQLSFLVHAG